MTRAPTCTDIATASAPEQIGCCDALSRDTQGKGHRPGRQSKAIDDGKHLATRRSEARRGARGWTDKQQSRHGSRPATVRGSKRHPGKCRDRPGELQERASGVHLFDGQWMLISADVRHLSSDATAHRGGARTTESVGDVRCESSGTAHKSRARDFHLNPKWERSGCETADLGKESTSTPRVVSGPQGQEGRDKD